MQCTDCGEALRYDSITSIVCTHCAARYWMRGIELVRHDREPVARTVAERSQPEPAPTPPTPPRGNCCQVCTAELVFKGLTMLSCPVCQVEYWMRGAELVRGTPEAVEDHIPRAVARIRRRDD